MSQRNSDSVEASRWKKKFLDALEDQDKREKTLINRIKLLRRGLVGVSLAGDGLDYELDRELAALRTTLRSEDSEAGLEVLLEHIEKSVLRLDSRKEHSTWAIQNALTLSISQLQELELSRELKRGIKQYSKALAAKVSDPQNHSELIATFLELLRLVVRELSEEAEAPASSSAGGFWSRLFSLHHLDTSAEGADAGEASDAPAHVPAAERTQAVSAESLTPARGATLSSASLAADAEWQMQDNPEQDDQPESTGRVEGVEGVEGAEGAGSAPTTETQEPSSPEPDDVSPAPQESEVSGSSAQVSHEPGFSAIANHAEPVLLRILENIYVSEQSITLATKIRDQVARGLNWYEFVAVLEDISAVITSSLSQERSEFQRFLNELNAGLGQVQQYVQLSRALEQEARDSDSALDQAVRTQVSGIASSVESASDIGELKSAVQHQLDAILSSMDGFKVLKNSQEDASGEQTRMLEERLKGMEEESRELRLHLAQQEQKAMRDALTELPNRAAYDRQIRHETEQWLNSQGLGDGKELCLIICDVDHFKRINDTYGHLAGDKVLKVLAREISNRVRKSDFVARYGGEEFAIVMANTSLEDAERLTNKLRQAIEQCPFHFKEKQVQITMSFGVAAFQPGDTSDLVFDRADKALYSAKEQGRNRVCVAAEGKGSA
ncbi:MAG: diguanylate cyclase [Gammaproteobacteria bacterium]|nr:diguanylate cyclase [Gammaproteobacteria bacterium]